MSIESKKNTIVFVLPNLKIGGAQRVFINYLRLINDNQFNIFLILINKVGSFIDLIPSNVKVFNLDLKRTRFGFSKLVKIIRKINPELVVSTTNYLNILVLVSSFFMKDKTNICLYEPSMPNSQMKNKHFPRYYFWLIKLLYRKADYIIAQSEEMKEEIIKYFSPPKNEIIVTINPLDETLIQNQLKNKSNPYNSEKLNIIVSGRISEEKGQDILIRAFKNVLEQNNRFKLNILGSIGNQDYYNELNKLINDLNLNEYIEFLGFKTNPYPYYKFADLLVLPSRWEGLPNVVLEALYLQTPVVVTNCIPFFERFLKEGSNGYIVDIGDINSMSAAILNYNKLKVDEGTVPQVNMEKIFNHMISHE